MGKLVGNLVHSAREWRGAMAVAVLLLDAALTVIIVAKVPYTEIDWIAYMEEVQGFLAGEKNYSLLRGTTGPLVYPGGFVWIYSGLYWLCDEGKDIALAQIIFIFVYLATQAVVLALYTKAKLVPAWALLLLMLSKRVHSIFVLRMFNDSVAALLMYTAILFFVNRRWTLGCVLYSAAVSVKMSALLFAPPLFFLLLCEGGVVGAARRIAICALVQVLAGLPFLLAHPVSYVRGAFDLGRIFMHRWSVNLKFLPEQVFVSRPLAVGLLAAHLLTLGAFFARHLRSRAANIRVWRGTGDLVPEFVCMVLFGGNFIGVVFARTLHFQESCDLVTTDLG